MSSSAKRPDSWRKVINQESETCHWVDPDGISHPGTAEENAEVRRLLLNMRARGEALDHKLHEH